MSQPRFLHVGHVEPEVGWSMAAHRHKAFCEFIVVVKGKLEVVTREQTLLAEPGNVVLYACDQEHQERAVGSSALESIFIGWDPASINATAWPIMVNDSQERIKLLAQWMLETQRAGTEPLGSLLDALLVAFVHAYTNDGDGEPDPVIGRIKQYIRKNIASPLSLADLADIACLSPFHFARRFEKAIGVSPMRFVRNARIDAARSLLLSSDLPVRTIATQVGFADHCQLSRVFHRELGRAPSSFRNR